MSRHFVIPQQHDEDDDYDGLGCFFGTRNVLICEIAFVACVYFIVAWMLS